MKLTKNEIAIRGVVSELLATMLCNGGELQISKTHLLAIGASADKYAVQGEDYGSPTDILLITDFEGDSPSIKVIDDDNKNHRNAIYEAYDPDLEVDLTGGEDRTLQHIDNARERYSKASKEIVEVDAAAIGAEITDEVAERIAESCHGADDHSVEDHDVGDFSDLECPEDFGEIGESDYDKLRKSDGQRERLIDDTLDLSERMKASAE